ncbi:MAG: hypothetical protein M3306_20270 [Actinomycetota bacterium]|nr:hypothetical protein [Actinomycetota bacterium]
MSESAVVRVVLPALGESVEQATVSAWFKRPRGTVALGEPVIEVSTD